MTQRTEKVASLVHQTVAVGIITELGPEATNITVTKVDVSPDLKTAIIWLGILGPEDKRKTIFQTAQNIRSALQSDVAHKLTTKYVPRIELRLDTGGDYAAHINEIIRQL